MVDEARVLMAKTVVILTPNMGGEQIVERGNGPTPRQMAGHLQPFRMLIEHRIDDVNESFITGEEAVAAGEQITFQPALALMLAQYFHHAAISRDMVVLGNNDGGRATIGDFKNGAPAV